MITHTMSLSLWKCIVYGLWTPLWYKTSINTLFPDQCHLFRACFAPSAKEKVFFYGLSFTRQLIYKYKYQQGFLEKYEFYDSKDEVSGWCVIWFT